MIDWTQIITKAYWPILIIIILLLFKSKISKIFFKHSSFGEFLMEINNDKKFLNKEESKSLLKLDATDIWFIYDLSKKGIIVELAKMNPVQRFAYRRLRETPFIKVEDGRLSLTENGVKVLELAGSI